MCVSYRKLNSITRPYRFPIRRCDDAILSIGTTKYFIKMDLETGYWQIPVHEKSKAKLAFFGVDEKLTFAAMPMGALNAAPVFAAMMEVLQQQWKDIARKKGLKASDSKVIIDDVILHGTTINGLLEFFKCVLTVLQQHRATVKLKKCKFLTQREEFVGRDIFTRRQCACEIKAQRLQQPKPTQNLP